MRGLVFSAAFFLVACLPVPVAVDGRRCETDADCGPNYICFRQACAVEGSIESLQLDGPALAREGSDEGGAEAFAGGARRTALIFGIEGWATGPALPLARSGHAMASAGGALIVAGGLEGGVPHADVWRLPEGTTTWLEGPPLPTPRSGLGAVGHAGALYALGGRAADGTLLDEVWMSRVEPDGSLGPWSATTPLPAGRAAVGVVAHGGFLFAIGGVSQAGVLGEVLRSAVKGDGSLGPWRSIATLEGRRRGFSVASTAEHLYVVGGTCESATCPVLSARFLSDGTLQPWRAQVSYPTPRFDAAAVATAGGLYALGGTRPDGVPLADAWGSVLAANGDLLEWQALPGFTSSRSKLTAGAVAGRLFAVGGESEGTASAQTLLAPLSHRGSLDWEDVSDLPGPRQGLSLVAHEGAVYAVGGQSSGSATGATTVLRASITAAGTLGPWSAAGTLSRPVVEAAVVFVDRRLYVIGGEAQVNDGSGSQEAGFAELRADGTLGSFQQTTPLPSGRFASGAASWGGRIYVVGGGTGYGNAQREVWVTTVDPSSGELGSWSPTTSLPSPRLGGMLVASHGRLYFLGGATERFNGYSKDTLIGRLGPGGEIVSWEAGPPLSVARVFGAAVVVDNRLHAIGGCNDDPGSYCGNRLSLVEGARLEPDGALGEWSALGSLRNSRSGMGAVAIDGRIFVAGGNGGNVLGSAEQAEVTRSGLLGPWRKAGSLTTPRGGFAALSHEGRVYVLGGADAQVSSAQLTDGAVGEWKQEPALPEALSSASASVLADRAYVIGGSLSGQPTAHVWSAALTATGLESWEQGPPLAAPTLSHAVATTGAALYVLGGTAGSLVQWARRLPDGTLGPWEATTPLPASRTGHQAFAYGRHVYVLGGRGSGEILYAAIQAEGQLGEWRQTTALPGWREGFTAVAQSGYLYIAGGSSGGTAAPHRSTWAAPIHEDGSVGTFHETKSLLSPVLQQQTVVSDGYVYLFGGQGPGSPADVQSAPIFAPTARGAWTWRIDLGRQVSSIDRLSLQGSTTGSFQLEYRLAGEEGAFGELVGHPPAVPGRELSFSASQTRYLWLRAKLDDRSAVTQGELTGLELDFHP